MQIIDFSDPHISGKNPICRKDDLVEVQFEKLREVINLSNDMNAPLICNGDLTHIPNIAYSVYNRLYRELKRMNEDCYFVIGQHDLWWHTMESFSHTALGALYDSLPNLKHISEFSSIQYGFAYCDWGEKILSVNEPFLLSHRPVITRTNNHRAWIKANPDHCMDFDDLDMYRLILCGDWHKSYSKIEYDNVDNVQRLLINPGCLCRRDANDDNKHMPSVVIIELDTLIHERHYLECAKPYEEVINESHLELTRAKREIKNNLSNIVDVINRAKSTGDTSQFISLLMGCIDDEMDIDLKKEINASIKRVFGDGITYGANVKDRPRLKRRD